MLLECNTLVAKFNKLHELIDKVKEGREVKELAKKLKTLFIRVGNLSKQIQDKNEIHSILHKQHTASSDDDEEAKGKKHVHFRQEVQIL